MQIRIDLQSRKKLVKLTKTDEFSSVFSFRKRVSAQFLAFHYQPNQKELTRLGLVVAKKIAKKAVDRNYMRRVLRELYRKYTPQGEMVDLVIRVQRPFQHKNFWLVEQEFAELVLRMHKKLNPKVILEHCDS